MPMSDVDMRLALGSWGANYAESVAIGAMSNDSTIEISLRLARFPARNAGSVWLHVAIDGDAWTLVDEDVGLDAARVPATTQKSTVADGGARLLTPVHADAASFVGFSPSAVRFDTRQRNGDMRGDVQATLRAHAARHPEAGRGDVPVALALTFTAAGPGARLNDGRRWELFGRVQGDVTISGRRHEIDLPGKWHEQVGERASFAPAFTYFNVQGDGIGLLAIRYATRSVGFALLDGPMLGVRQLTIEPYGAAVRTFDVELDDGSRVNGQARVVQTWSVPIEGQRRPGAGVVVDSNRGRLVGSLNDWDPSGALNEVPSGD
jgi:hypothetical protein